MNSSKKPWESTRLPYISGAGESPGEEWRSARSRFSCVRRACLLRLLNLLELGWSVGRSVDWTDGRFLLDFSPAAKNRRIAARYREKRAQEERGRDEASGSLACLGMPKIPNRDIKIQSWYRYFRLGKFYLMRRISVYYTFLTHVSDGGKTQVFQK